MAKMTPQEEQAFAQDEAEERDEHRRFSAAKDETDREIFRDVLDGKEPEPEDDGDRSLENIEEDMAGGDPEDVEEEEEQEEDEQDESDEEDDGGEEADEGQAPEITEPQRNERSERFVPSNRLREETERRERAERELAEIRARGMPPPQAAPPPQPPPQKPDMFVDPDAHDEYLIQQMLARQHRLRQEVSMQEAAEEHGPDFHYAYNVLQQAVRRNDPTAHQIVAALNQSANPGRAFMRWAEPLLQDYRGQQEAEREQWLRDRFGVEPEELERRPVRGQGQQRPPSSPRRGVPSLNSAGSSGGPRTRIDPRGMDGSEEAIFNDVWDTPRR